MNARTTSARDEARTSRRFVPREALNISIAGGTAVPVHGNVRDISPVGACVATDRALQNGLAITLDVRCGYDFLFQAGARVVWQTRRDHGTDAFECLQGMRFTELSPFSRSLILRLSDDETGGVPTSHETVSLPGLDDAESDPDLDLGFGLLLQTQSASDESEASLETPVPAAEADAPAYETVSETPEENENENENENATPTVAEEDGRMVFDLLTDPDLERALLAGGRIDLRSSKEEGLDAEADPTQALAGDLEQFDVTVVLQMLEVTRSTGVLYIESRHDGGDPRVGEIHFDSGRICGFFSGDGVEDEGPFQWVVANRGRFQFFPRPAGSDLRRGRSTTGLLLEWQIRSDDS